MQMRILFVTRKYPPKTGGMEQVAFHLQAALSKTNEVDLVANASGKNWRFPVTYAVLSARAFVHGLRNKPDVIYLQDGIMATLGWLLKLVLGRPAVITIHGLEATYQNPLYRLIVTPFIRRADALVAVSNETKQKVERGLPGSKPAVIFNGLSDEFYEPKPREEQLETIARATKIPLETLQAGKILHTNGRLVRRKGVHWFVDNVLPQLPDETFYFVSGKGKDDDRIRAAIAKHGLQKRVKLLGRVSDEVLRALYNSADLFLMPNIPVPGDMEGFGLVALEAASCGRTVLAAKLEGIQDAIIDGKNGHLVEPHDADAWAKTVKKELRTPTLDSQKIRDYTLGHYSWQRTAEQYEQLMKTVVKAAK